MDNSQLGLWIYNIIVSKEFISSICGGLAGGGLSILVARLTLSTEFKNQNKIINRQNKEKEKAAFLVIEDEIKENIILFEDYIKIVNSQPIRVVEENQSIDLNKFKGESAYNFSWNEFKGIIISSQYKDLIKDIQKFYHTITSIKCSTHIKENVLKELISNGNNIIKNIEEIQKDYTY